MDMVFGTLATVIAAIITKLMVKVLKHNGHTSPDMVSMLLLPLPTVIVNAVVIPFVLYYGYGVVSMGSSTAKSTVLLLLTFSIAAGEIISCYVFGPILVNVMKFVEDRMNSIR